MKKSILTSGFILTLLFVLSGISLQAQTEEELKAKIEKINSKLAKAMMEGDYEKGLSFYTEDAISMPNYSPMLKGIEAIKASNAEMMKSGAKIKSFEAKTKKIISCGDMIIEIGKYTISMEMPGMEEPMNDNGKYITIWEKQSDGSLKVKIDTWNTDINPMEKGHEM
jgi:ketosteroid isomerase-like protein